MKTSEIIVIISHYNHLQGLYKSLESISDIEPVDVVIIDDNSREKPDIEFIRQKFHQINSIHCIYHEKNVGAEIVKNSALEYILEKNIYKYVAILDAGDLCIPERFKVQKEFMDSNPEVYLCGSFTESIDMAGNHLYWNTFPTEHEEIVKKTHKMAVIVHSTAFFRTEALPSIGYYSGKYKKCEDFEYFFRFIKKYKVAIIAQYLVKYEINDSGVTVSHVRKQALTMLKIILENYEIKYTYQTFQGFIEYLAIMVLGRLIYNQKLNRILKKIRSLWG